MDQKPFAGNKSSEIQISVSMSGYASVMPVKLIYIYYIIGWLIVGEANKYIIRSKENSEHSKNEKQKYDSYWHFNSNLSRANMVVQIWYIVHMQ